MSAVESSWYKTTKVGFNLTESCLSKSVEGISKSMTQKSADQSIIKPCNESKHLSPNAYAYFYRDVWQTRYISEILAIRILAGLK